MDKPARQAGCLAQAGCLFMAMGLGLLIYLSWPHRTAVPPSYVPFELAKATPEATAAAPAEVIATEEPEAPADEEQATPRPTPDAGDAEALEDSPPAASQEREAETARAEDETRTQDAPALEPTPEAIQIAVLDAAGPGDGALPSPVESGAASSANETPSALDSGLLTNENRFDLPPVVLPPDWSMVTPSPAMTAQETAAATQPEDLPEVAVVGILETPAEVARVSPAPPPDWRIVTPAPLEYVTPRRAGEEEYTLAPPVLEEPAADESAEPAGVARLALTPIPAIFTPAPDYSPALADTISSATAIVRDNVATLTGALHIGEPGSIGPLMTPDPIEISPTPTPTPAARSLPPRVSIATPTPDSAVPVISVLTPAPRAILDHSDLNAIERRAGGAANRLPSPAPATPRPARAIPTAPLTVRDDAPTTPMTVIVTPRPGSSAWWTTEGSAAPTATPASGAAVVILTPLPDR